MQLKSRLGRTTFGDVLGTVHRAGASGVLEIHEPTSGRTHRVHFSEGKVIQVDLDGASTPLLTILRERGALDAELPRRTLLRAMASHRLVGDVLVSDFHVDKSVVDAALRRQILERLAKLEALKDGHLSFRVAVRPPRNATAGLDGKEFLPGRKRHRDTATPAPPKLVDDTPFRILGLSQQASLAEVRAAYRSLAKTLHPDLHPNASVEERAALGQRLARATEAYRALTG